MTVGLDNTQSRWGWSRDLGALTLGESPKVIQERSAQVVHFSPTHLFTGDQAWVVRDLEAGKEAVRQAYGDCTVVKQRKKLCMKLASDLLQARNWPVLPVQSTTASSTDPSSLTLASRFEHQPFLFDSCPRFGHRRFLDRQPSGKVQLEFAESSSGSQEGSTSYYSGGRARVGRTGPSRPCRGILR
jgi:hypothetical protein